MWRRIAKFVHDYSGAKLCLQLGHKRRQGLERVPWEGMDRPLVAGNWPLIAPSDVAWTDENAMPTPDDAHRHGTGCATSSSTPRAAASAPAST